MLDIIAPQRRERIPVGHCVCSGIVHKLSEMRDSANERPLFIFGAARSGTSLVSRIIDGHPEIAVPYESRIYSSFYADRHLYGDLGVAENRRRLIRDILATRAMKKWVPQVNEASAAAAVARPDFAGVMAGIVRSWIASRQDGASRWGEKSPQHVFCWREILRDFPDAQVIHVVRDGRDVAMSLKKARFGPKHYYFIARYWSNYLQVAETARAHLPDDRFFELRYEQLLTDTLPVLESVCSFLGVEFDDRMLAYHQTEALYRTDKRNLANLRKPLILTNANKWQREMRRTDLEVFESVAEQSLRKFGYEPAGVARDLSPFERRKFRVQHKLLRFWSMAKNWSGYVEGLEMLMIRLRRWLRRPLQVNHAG